MSSEMNGDVYRFLRSGAAEGMTPGERLVLIFLGENFNPGYGYAFPSVKSIGQYAGLKDRQVQNILRSLGKRGLLTTGPRFEHVEGRVRQTSNAYYLVIPQVQQPAPPRRIVAHPPGPTDCTPPVQSAALQEPLVEPLVEPVRDTTPPTPPEGAAAADESQKVIAFSERPKNPPSPAPSWPSPRVETCSPLARETNHKDEATASFYDEILDYCAGAMGYGKGRARLRAGQQDAILEHIDRMVIGGRSHDEIRFLVKKAMNEGEKPISYLRTLAEGKVRPMANGGNAAKGKSSAEIQAEFAEAARAGGYMTV